MKSKELHMAAFLFTVIGALNWGLVGLFDFNLVETLFGTWPVVVQAVYVLVGLGAVYLITTHKDGCKWCTK